MKKVIFAAPAYTSSGYGVHSRQIARILNNFKEFDVALKAVQWGNTPFMLGDFEEKNILDLGNSRYALISEEAQKSGKQHEFDLSFQLILPDEWDTSMAKFNVGITAGVETTLCSDKWIEACNVMDLVIVPSNHVKQTFLNSGNLNTPIEVVPECFPEYLENMDLSCDFNLDLKTNFNFLHIGQIGAHDEANDRKSIYTLIRIFCKAFEENDDVGLVLKVNSGRNTLIDRDLTINKIKEFVSHHRNGKLPNIYVIHGPTSTEDICKLYKHEKIKAFISLTKGEGFGLPLLEAAAAGLPILATNWSSYLDFLNLTERSFIKLNYRLNNVPENRMDNRIFVKGAQWAHVIEEDVIKKMKKLHESYDIPKRWASDLQVQILKNYNFEKIQKIFREKFKKHYKEEL